jgi:hypothetical protein
MSGAAIGMPARAGVRAIVARTKHAAQMRRMPGAACVGPT